MDKNRTDQQIQKDVVDELAWDPRVIAQGIGVNVTNGVVTLTGHVDTYYKKWSAQDAAHHVRGVRAVANELHLKLASTAQRTDEEIATAAMHAIEGDATLGDKLRVTVSQGIVTVSGEVEWNLQKEDAERALRRLAGVRGMTNSITVRQRSTPAEVKDKIKRALERLAVVDASSVSVEVQGSKAILSGNVRSWSEREQVARTAWVAPGISQVEDQIRIGS